MIDDIIISESELKPYLEGDDLGNKAKALLMRQKKHGAS